MSRNFEDFDEKNIEIAKMLINDSEKITIDEKTNEKIIKSIRNGRKKKFGKEFAEIPKGNSSGGMYCPCGRNDNMESC